MEKFLKKYEHDDLSFLVYTLNSMILELDEKNQLLRDFKDEIVTYLSNDKEV